MSCLLQIGLLRVGIARNLDSCRTHLCVNASHKYALDFMFSCTLALGLVLVLVYILTGPKFFLTQMTIWKS